MAGNPLVPQGFLNKLIGSMSFIDHPDLNITSSFLGDAGISLAFEGNASEYIGTMTGAVPSPNPYQMVTATAHILKTQGLGDAFKAQIEETTTIGDIVVTSDTSTLSQYYLSNCIIKNVPELTFAGKTPDFTIVFQGTYYINADLFQ